MDAMSDRKDIRFIEPTSFEIRPIKRSFMMRAIMEAFPNFIKNEQQASKALLIFSGVCFLLTFFLYWNLLFGGQQKRGPSNDNDVTFMGNHYAA